MGGRAFLEERLEIVRGNRSDPRAIALPGRV
jgi:hypothetical protein